jgi:hypothetical protein
MKEIAIFEFTVKCLVLLDPVRKTKKPIRITRFGKSIVEVTPPFARPRLRIVMDSMNSRIEILGGYCFAPERAQLRF